MPNILISYRRADADAMAGRIRDRLASHFGETSIFMDVESIPFGTDFREHIKQTLTQDNVVVIAVVSPKWLGPRRRGAYRIMEETDPVRIEIETALQRASPIIPVLVGGASMPPPADLPDGLKDFSFRNAAEVDAGRDFHPQMERLIRSIELILAAKAAPAGPGATPTPSIATAATKAASAAEAGEPAAAATPPAKRQASHRPVVAALALLLLAVIGGTAAWIFLGQSPEKKVVEPPSTQPPSAVLANLDCKAAAPTAFSDTFKAIDPAWSFPKDQVSFVDGQLAIKPIENKLTRVTYPPLRYTSYALCATFRSPISLGSPDADTDGGLMFWAADISNFYRASVYPDGAYSIQRLAGETWTPIRLKTPFKGIRTGEGAFNRIQVTIKANVATLFVNGDLVEEIRGEPPTAGSIIGLYATSEQNRRNEWRVLNVAVADLNQRGSPPSVGLGCIPPGAAALEDRFRTLDPRWGATEKARASHADGQLVLTPSAGKGWKQFYSSLSFANATICTRVKSPSMMKDEQDTAFAGIAFWGVDDSNYYTAAILPRGQFGIYRMVQGRWSSIARETMSPAVRAGLEATNEVMVDFKGPLASFHINGEKVFEFSGQPPADGGTLGVFAASEDAAENEWRFLKYVVVENR